MRGYTVRRKDLLYPELSFTLNGIFFDIFKQLGGGHLEKYYQKAVKIGLEKAKLTFQEQLHTPLLYQGEKVGTYFLDFLVEGKIVIELKRGQFVPAHNIIQAKQYLSALDLQLALIVCFPHKGVYIKRIVNKFS
jgi:GxxExxY protein